MQNQNATHPSYADLVLPVPVPRTFTYFIPTELREIIVIGQRVVVPFGKSKWYAGVVVSLHHQAPKAYDAKDIIEVLDDSPIVQEQQLELWIWIAKYYMCSIGEVMNAAMPSVFKLQSETRVLYNPDFDKKDEPWTDKQAMVVDALKIAEVLSLSDIQGISGLKNVMPLVKSLMDQGVLHVEEEIREGYKPKTIDYVRLMVATDAPSIQPIFERLKRAEKQSRLLLYFLSVSDYGKNPVKKSLLTDHEEFSLAQVKALEQKGIFEIFQEEVSRQQKKLADSDAMNVLSKSQAVALNEIKVELSDKEICLLYGITSSGKTAVYISLIKDMLAKGSDVLYMLPEIALTTQIIDRLQFHFGKDVLVYHSRLTNQERADIWKEVLAADGAKLLVGTRSSVFLPPKNIGLIIVDEEHEPSYKQQDPAPRYHARDVAVVLGNLLNAPVLLGSATPSIESSYNAQLNKYGKVVLNERYGGVALPDISFVNMRKARLHKQVQGDFSDLMVDTISSALERKEQVILFQNRRGFAPLLECQACGWIPQCKSCDISLTYHKAIHRLKCHYCGYQEPVPTTCSSCGSNGMLDKGLGTEKIEEELKQLFPEARIRRMDQDTTRKKNALPELINQFADRKIDILVGTQMLSKGLDFDNVGLVGVLNADQMLHFPDFRAFERCYQLLTQVAGRAGRRADVGKVLIQSYNPEHGVLQQVAQHAYGQLYNEQMAERKQFGYPPVVRMIRIILKHKNYQTLNEAADLLTSPLKAKFGTRVLGPEFPPIARIRNLYHKHFIIKLEKQHAGALKEELQKVLNGFSMQSGFRSVRVVVDVDPY